MRALLIHNIRDLGYQKFDVTPQAGSGLVNFATIVYHFLPHPPDLSFDREDRDPPNGSPWRIAIPARQEYMALCLLFHPDRHSEGEGWMQRLNSEWDKWEELENTEQSALTMQELGRAFVREQLKVQARNGGLSSSISAKILKWESRIRELRELHKNITFDKLESLLADDMTKFCLSLNKEPDELSTDPVSGANTGPAGLEVSSADAGADTGPSPGSQ